MRVTELLLFTPDGMVHEASMGPNWDRQDPGGPQVGPMNFAIWNVIPPKLTTSRLPTTHSPITQPFWYFAQSTVALHHWPHSPICIHVHKYSHRHTQVFLLNRIWSYAIDNYLSPRKMYVIIYPCSNLIEDSSALVPLALWDTDYWK